VEDRDLCFTRLLPQEQVEAALERRQVRYRQRLYTALLRIWTFLYQVLASDPSCRAAVARLLAFLCVGGEDSRSAVATHRVNDRPDRVEPRAVKRRPKKRVYLNEPRAIAKARLINAA
jgi:hypothetical protein